MSTRQKRRTKRRVKQSQKLAWMVELRLLGLPTATVLRLKECGNFTQAHRYYQSLLSQTSSKP